MTLPNTFANETNPSMDELDENFAAVAAMAIWNTIETGTNALTLTPTADQPAVTASTNNQKFQFTALNSSNGAVTLQVGSLASLPLYKAGGSQAGSGDVAAGSFYLIVYLSALNAAAGGFLIISAVPASAVAPTTLAATRGLAIGNNSSTPSTKIDMQAGQICLVTTGGTPIFFASQSVTIDLTTTGANGMDTGARPTSGWVYLYFISNGSITAGLASATSPTAGAPTMPGGYSYLCYVGAMRCDGSQNLLRSQQRGLIAQYTITTSTNTALPPNIANGVAGTFSSTSPVLTTASIASVVPLTASRIVVLATNAYNGGTTAAVIVASNTGWGGTNRGPAGSANAGWPVYLANGAVRAVTLEIILETTTIAWSSDAAGGAISCWGWVDYWSR